MEVKRYRIGTADIELRLPFGIDDTFPFSLFLTDKISTVAHLYEFSFADMLLPTADNPVFVLPDRIVFENEKNVLTYYKKYNSDAFFARRTDIKGTNIGYVEYADEYKNELWDKSAFDTIGFENIALSEKMLIMHASFINVNGEAILFTAPRQTGKSTQARLWHETRGAEIINGDKALVYISDGTVNAGSLPYCGSSSICKNASLPLKAIVKLGQGNNTIKKTDISSAVRTVINGCYLPFGAQNVLDCVAETARNIPVFTFDCTPDENAVRILENTLW